MSYPAASPWVDRVTHTKRVTVSLQISPHTTAASVTARIKPTQAGGAPPGVFEAAVANGAGAVTGFVYAVTAGTTIGIGVFDPKAVRPVSARGVCVATSGTNAALGTLCYCIDPTAVTSGANGGLAPGGAGTATGGAAFMLTFEGSLTATIGTNSVEFEIALEWL